MYVNADNLLPRALSIVFHEVGHGLHDILNPEQWRQWYEVSKYPDELPTWRAHTEAIAMVFGAANFRILAEHTGVETSALPEGWYIPDSYYRLHLELRCNPVQFIGVRTGSLRQRKAADMDGGLEGPGVIPSQAGV